MPSERLSLRFARMLERRAPRLAQGVAAPRVAGAVHSTAGGGASEYWTPADDIRSPTPSDSRSPSILLVTDKPVSARWLGASLSVGLGAQVIVVRSGTESAASSQEDLDVDAIVGVGVASSAAITLCRRSRAGRLALVSPVALPASVPSGLPTTLIQSAASGAERRQVNVFERTLRATGTAVRDTDYPSTPDEWVRLPRLIRGSSAALDDLVAFLERGIGVQSTFEVIPGWDLH